MSAAEAEASPPITEWLHRCAAARAKNEAIPEAILFRRMLTHDDYHSCAAVAAEEQAHCDEAPLGGPGSSVEVYCGAEVAQEVAGRPEELQRYTGLQLTAALAAHTSELRLFFSRDSPPLVLGESEVAHFRSFLQVTVVELVLARMQAGDELPVDRPFGRLRDFDGFMTVCAGGHVHTGSDGKAPLKMALAPDAGGEGRRLAAVFTAEDALQLFVVSRDSVSGNDGLVSVRLTGRELFEQVRPRNHPSAPLFCGRWRARVEQRMHPTCVCATDAHACHVFGGTHRWRATTRSMGLCSTRVGRASRSHCRATSPRWCSPRTDDADA